ncbi:MAG TPA: L-2-hydroxyglutarate oxidase [Tepidisphaeraceae bacterium]|nr:L-2-hydroxyglutarate oxidase [Tepidisphaeraceae bacterium]
MNHLMPTPAHGPVFAHTPARSASFDVAVIGGGAVGLATAMALLGRRPIRLVVLEAEDKLAAHQTGHNSGVIHSGLYYKPGSLKARLCIEGREAIYAFCQQHNIPHERCGKVVVATRESELPALAELERRGMANGLAGIRRLRAEELREFEPHAAGIAAVHVPQTGIVNYARVTRAYGDVVRQLGGEVRTNSRVQSVTPSGRGLHLSTASGDIECAGLINCGGLQSDRIARMCGVEPGVQIVPFRGEYYQLVDSRASLVRNLIYPVPDPRFPFLGVHFTRMIDGGVEAGPNAVLALARHGYTRTSFNFPDALAVARYGGFWRMARKYWKTAMGEFYRSFSKRAFLHALRRLMPELQLADLVPGGAGVRAQALEPSGALVDDFRIVCAPRMVHVLNAPSPAATASIAIGRYIADQAAEALSLPTRPAPASPIQSH